MKNNFGLGSRDLEIAGRLAARSFYESYSSVALMAKRWKLFVIFLKKQTQIKHMEDITRANVLAYGFSLKSRYEKKSLARKSLVNYVSAVNQILSIARSDELLSVMPVRDLCLPKKLEPRIDRGARYSPELCDKLKPNWNILTKLQRHWGFRLEESGKLDARAALEEVLACGQLNVCKGTTAGKPRAVTLRDEAAQMNALREAVELQGAGKSMIPADLDYKKFKAAAHNAAHYRGIRFHDGRHAFCQALYLRLTGWKAPLSLGLSKKKHMRLIMSEHGISEAEYRERDYQARMTVSREVGHERVSVTTAYLG